MWRAPLPALYEFVHKHSRFAEAVGNSIEVRLDGSGVDIRCSSGEFLSMRRLGTSQKEGVCHG